MTLSIEELQETVDLVEYHGGLRETERKTGIAYSTLRRRITRASEKGLNGTRPVLPGYSIKKISTREDAHGNITQTNIQQTKEAGEKFELPEGHTIKGVSTLVDADGQTIQSWIKTSNGTDPAEFLRAMLDGMKDELPRAALVPEPSGVQSELLNQYTLTDVHLGMLAWYDETGDADYDLKIAETLIMNWFKLAIQLAPNSEHAVFAQMGDFLHQDSHDPVTPASRHVLDSDSRFQKTIRAALRIKRVVVRMLLEKHKSVKLIIADANHDPASGAWMRECFAMYYEEEPRVIVDTSADTYYAHEFGLTALFYHHGHKRRAKNVDSVFVGKFRELYGRTKYAYGHTGHLHNDELVTTNLMKIEQHETLAPKDAYAAKGGWLSGRSAKVITYHKDFGEVGRNTITPAMVAGTPIAANDNTPHKEMKNVG